MVVSEVVAVSLANAFVALTVIGRPPLTPAAR